MKKMLDLIDDITKAIAWMAIVATICAILLAALALLCFSGCAPTQHMMILRKDGTYAPQGDNFKERW
jgi:predicted lysophospholipase L1 biosynthesis ABC-type transport system permease subunit